MAADRSGIFFFLRQYPWRNSCSLLKEALYATAAAMCQGRLAPLHIITSNHATSHNLNLQPRGTTSFFPSLNISFEIGQMMHLFIYTFLKTKSWSVL